MTLDYRNARVLVTGADGFAGSHLVERLLSLGAEVTVFVRGSSHCGTAVHKLKNLRLHRHELHQIIVGDLACADSIELIRSAEPDIIFHLAAIAYVNYSFTHPLETHASNATGTLHVLEAARRISRLRQIVVTSSSEVYGPCTGPINEDHPLRPTSPYAASKLAAEKYAHAYRTTYGLPLTLIRPFNYYGPRLLYDVIPKFIQMALRGESPTIYGDGNQMRDFTYVSDMIDAFLLMGSSALALGETVNFGSGVSLSINAITEIILDAVGGNIKPKHVEERQAEVSRLECDYSKANRLFGWKPQVSIEEGVKRTVDWFKDNLVECLQNDL